MRGLHVQWLVAALRLGQGRIVLKAERFAVHFFLDGTICGFARLALALGAVGGCRESAWPGRRLRRDSGSGAQAEKESPQHAVFMDGLSI